MKISLVCSTRDNLKYLKWSYDSVRKNQGNHEVWICYGIDHSTDGTQDWIEEIKKSDPYVKSIENTSGKRLGHTIMYDRIINEIVETDLAMIFHSDMYLCPGALDAIEKFMYGENYSEEERWEMLQETGFDALQPPFNREYLEKWIPKKKQNSNRIVSLTRIEPPLHPEGKEKIVKDFGTEPSNFNESELLRFVKFLNRPKDIHYEWDPNPLKGTTNGIFAPWCFWVDEFQAIGGHDPLYSPQSKEDSDIFNRFKLNGCGFIQTWSGFVYHLTCRGSRFNPNLTELGKNSAEWEYQNLKSSKNFVRKWGHFVKHDEYLHPIIPHKYKTQFILLNSNLNLISTLEPWADFLILDCDENVLHEYLLMEQPNTSFNLKERLSNNPANATGFLGVQVEIDGRTFNQNDFEVIKNLSEIVSEQGELGEFEVGNLKLMITDLTSYENELIVCKN